MEYLVGSQIANRRTLMTIFRYGFRNSTHDLQKSTVPSMQACDTDIAHALDLCWNPSKRRGHRGLYLNNEIYSSNSFLLPRCVQRRLISKSFRRYLNTGYPLVRLCRKTEHRGGCFRSCIYIRTLWGQGWPLDVYERTEFLTEWTIVREIRVFLEAQRN